MNGIVLGNDKSFYGLFGGCLAELSHTSSNAFGNPDYNIIGLQFTTSNKGNWIPTAGLNDAVITTKGMRLFSTMGYTGYEYSGAKCSALTYGSDIAVDIQGQLDMGSTSVVYGEKITITDNKDSATADIDIYGLHLTVPAAINAGTSWGIYQASGVNNAINGQLRIGSVVTPTNALSLPLDKWIDFGSNTEKIGSDDANYMDYHATTAHRFNADVNVVGDVNVSGTVSGNYLFATLGLAASNNSVADITKRISLFYDDSVFATAFLPSVSNTFDLGTNTYQFKDAYVDGTAYIDTLDGGVATVTSLNGITITTENDDIDMEGAGTSDFKVRGYMFLDADEADGFRILGGDTAGQTLTVTTTDVTLNQSLATTDSVEFVNINATGEYQVDGTQVITNQQTHIADAPGDTAANNATTINAILTALETHGLLADG